VQQVRQALAEGGYAPDAEGRVAVDGHVLEPGEYELRTRPREGFEAVDDGIFVVAIDTQLTPELELEGRARELVRFLQTLRKELGLEVSDRIRLTFTANDGGRELWDAHGDYVANEVLAVEAVPGEGGEHRFEADGAELAFSLERAA
jgi:isoleucyl-tRNA synthetase